MLPDTATITANSVACDNMLQDNVNCFGYSPTVHTECAYNWRSRGVLSPKCFVSGCFGRFDPRQDVKILPSLGLFEI